MANPKPVVTPLASANALVFILSIGLAATAPAAESAVVWDVGAAGLFDESNLAYPIDHGRVDVDLQSPKDKCPTGLGHLASGRESVRVIALRFAAEKAGEYWLHVDWEPGGSGVEQFAVRANDKPLGTSRRVDAAKSPNAEQQEQFAVNYLAGVNTISLEFRSGDGLRFRRIILTTGQELPRIATLKPGMKFATQEAFASAIGEPAVMLDGANVRLLAPQRRAETARIVFGYIEKAYGELYAIVGMHTKYKIVVYAFPEGNPNITGGTSECEIRYSDKNLNPATLESSRGQPVPHVAGFIEEMAHNFVDAAHVQFGWEMVGWSLGVKVTTRLGNTPTFARSLRETRRVQLKTFQDYVKEGHVLPKSVPANLCDRIHAHLRI